MNLHSVLCSGLMFFFGFFPIKKNKIIFSSYYGKYYNDSPRYIYEEMARINPEMDYVWLLIDDRKEIINGRVIKKGSIRSLFELATAKVWVDNCRKPLWMRKREGQYYVQTWHAGISNKAGEKLTQDKLTADYVAAAIHDSEMADLFVSNSKWLTKQYRDYFWYTGKILECGLPREDSLYQDSYEYRKKVYNFYKIEYDTNIILYAPTFRDDGDIECYDMDYFSVIEELRRKTHKPWKMIIRMHPNIKERKTNIPYGENIIDGNSYEEINDLIMASDYVISDYSSCLFDSLIANKMTLIYASDFKRYEERRGFIFHWSETPFPIAETSNQLIELLRNGDIQQFEEQRCLFLNKVGFIRNQRASESVADAIFDIM